MRFRLIVLIAATLAVTRPVVAQECPGPTASSQEALELVELAMGEDRFRELMSEALEAQFQNNPHAALFEDAFREFFDRHFVWTEIRCEYARLYDRFFSDDELRELVAFYETDLGQTLADRMPTIFREGANIGLKIVREHQAELQRLIGARIRELCDSVESSSDSAAGTPLPRDPTRS